MAKRILLVDDDMDDSELFLEAMGEIDSSITCYNACDGEQALEKLQQIQPPDMIFLDINMPRMDGWQCLSILKSNPVYSNIPVIMYSTSSHQREVNRALELGAKGFFAKPESYKELIVTLKTVVAAS